MPNADWGAATDTGLRRSHNEDSYVAQPSLFAVADGMGGHRAGEVASRIAIDTLADAMSGPGAAGARAEDILAAVTRAHEEIVAAAGRDPDLTGMGTTVTGLAVVTIGGHEHWAVFNVGDSRVYRLYGGSLTQVTVDHSEVEELVAGGIIDREQARSDLRRNVITRSLGSEFPPQVDLWVFPTTPGETFLVCSDGLTGELTDAEIAELLQSSATARDAAWRLVDAAVSAGGRDNVTAVVVSLAPQDGADGVDEDTSPRIGAPS